MAVGMIARLPEGVGAEQYDAVQAQMDMDDSPVQGRIFECAGELEGSFQVFTVWENREDFDRFRQDRLGPAMAAAMGEEALAALPEADYVEASIHNYIVP